MTQRLHALTLAILLAAARPSLAVCGQVTRSGARTIDERERDSVNGLTGLDVENAVAISPDRTNDYATGTNGIAMFLHHANAGILSGMGANTDLKSPQGRAIS